MKRYRLKCGRCRQTWASEVPVSVSESEWTERHICPPGDGGSSQFECVDCAAPRLVSDQAAHTVWCPRYRAESDALVVGS